MEHLQAPVDGGRHRAGPGAMQHPVSCSDGAPDHASRVLVHRDQTWRPRRWDARMAFVLAVGGPDDEQITKDQHIAITSFMWKDTQCWHVQLPNDVCRTLVFEDLVPIRTIVFAIVETPCVEGAELTVGGDVVQALSFDKGNACRRRQQPFP